MIRWRRYGCTYIVPEKKLKGLRHPFFFGQEQKDAVKDLGAALSRTILIYLSSTAPPPVSRAGPSEQKGMCLRQTAAAIFPLKTVPGDQTR